jgi:hypothetical protein
MSYYPEVAKSDTAKKPGAKPQWVKLYLVPQTEVSDMPEFVVGHLTGEAAAGYVLNPMVELSEDGQVTQMLGMNIINKTYVWRCQILDSEPGASEGEENAEEGLGGLGED